MSKEKVLSLSIFCLAISIIISANIMANAIRDNGSNIFSGLSSVSTGINGIAGSVNNANNNSVVYSRSTYDLATAAFYLGITDDKLMAIISDKKSGIPYVKIGADYIFSKGALEKWLETTRFERK